MSKKVFKTINQQLSLLEDRNLKIEDKQKAHDYLLTNNYYNIINGYSKYFQINNGSGTDKYKDDASFDQVCKLYYFDKEVKQTMFNYILSVEHHLKSIFVYRFSERFKDIENPYLNINCYSSSKAEKTIKIIKKSIKMSKKSPTSPIHHYAEKYNSIPTWVMIDAVDFGTVMYSC